MERPRVFNFENYTYDRNSNELLLRYSFDNGEIFQERFTFPDIQVEESVWPAFDKACFAIFMLTGISYYKAYFAEEFNLKEYSLTKAQADFFQKFYTEGLSQYLYENDLDPSRVAKFVAESSENVEGAPELRGLSGVLVAFGGGKDTLTTLGILERVGVEVETFSVGGGEVLQKLAEGYGRKHYVVTREVDFKLKEVNDLGALNGHVPVTAIISLVSVALAIQLGRKSIVFSNDSSTEEPSLEYMGLPVNHQYAKTLAVEKSIQNYLATFVGTGIEYFSFLRPLSLLRISEIFISNFYSSSVGNFTSCNRNFRFFEEKGKSLWCGECTKCTFTFMVFAPFLDKSLLLELFGGKNLFLDQKLEDTFEGLLGLSGHKPLDCVGRVSENRQAIQLALLTGNYPELEKYNFDEPMTYGDFGPHVQPTWASQVLEVFLDNHK